MLGLGPVSSAPISALIVVGAIVGTATITFSQTGVLLNQGELLGNTTVTFTGTGLLLGAGPLTATGTLILSQIGTISAVFSTIASTTFGITVSGDLTNANAGTIWQNADGLFITFGLAESETRPAYATDTTPYLLGKRVYGQSRNGFIRII